MTGLRCEWAKSKARASRWNEEVLLVVEEMRRVIDYFDWKTHWWSEQGKARTDLDIDIADGIKAYAAKQGYINQQLASSFASKWCKVLVANDFPVEWPDRYNSLNLLADFAQEGDE